MTDEEIINSYLNTKSVWETGKIFNISGQKVHYILKKHNVKPIGSTVKNWTDTEIEELKILYSEFLCGDGKLNKFCEKYKKVKSIVCQKAKKLGLTRRQRKCGELQTKRNVDLIIKFHKNNPHPKGMLGKTHTDENKLKQSQYSKKRWSDPNNILNSKEFRQRKSDISSKNMEIQMKNKPETLYSRVKHGMVTIGDKTFFARSSWEANIGAYFQFLKEHKKISDWEHEPKTFWFTEIMRGVRSYKPDFLITLNDGTHYYEEVKGWMDPKSATKLKRMKKYYPSVKVDILDEKRYKAIKKMSSLIPQWGLLD